MELLNITELFKSNSDQFNALYRSCLKSLFSLIEADIFGLNNLDQYENYSDKHSFENKFKSTFTKVCTTWNKNEIREIYFDSKYCDLKELRKKRDELIHPKKVEHIHKATEQEFDKVKKVFTDYDNFINKLMDDFFIEAEVNAFDFINKITNTP
jgi:isocitrate dehydrogenase kinase/phosphatase